MWADGQRTAMATMIRWGWLSCYDEKEVDKWIIMVLLITVVSLLRFRIIDHFETLR